VERRPRAAIPPTASSPVPSSAHVPGSGVVVSSMSPAALRKRKPTMRSVPLAQSVAAYCSEAPKMLELPISVPGGQHDRVVQRGDLYVAGRAE
jgi:hypothetical protein